MATAPILLSPANKQKCRTAVRILKRENVIALSTVSDGPGPLSLIQVCTLKGTVYLFDVLKNGKEQDEDFLRDTGLAAVLTSTEIVKVVHAFARQSAAFFYQFGIRLNNVFDAEVALRVTEEHQGRKVIRRLREEKRYESDWFTENDCKHDKQLQWNKVYGNYRWTTRPLTQEMIDYACGKVAILIPDVYDSHKRYLEVNNLVDKFKERVQEELDFDINPDVGEQRKKRVNELSNDVLTSMAEKYKEREIPIIITDEDEKSAIRRITLKQISEAKYPEVIRQLKVQNLARYLEGLNKDMKTPDTFYPNAGILFTLNDITEQGTPALMKEGTRIKERVLSIFADDLEKKYDGNVHVPLTKLSQIDIDFLKILRPSNDDTLYPKSVLDIYWKITDEKYSKDLEKLDTDVWYEAYGVQELKRVAKDSGVPENVQIKAKEVRKKNDEGIIERIPRKYNSETTVDQLDDVEKHALAKLDVIRNTYDPVVVSLHWEVTYFMLCKELEEFRAGTLQGELWLSKKLEFLTTNDMVTDKVKRKAEEFRRYYQRVMSQN